MGIDIHIMLEYRPYLHKYENCKVVSTEKLPWTTGDLYYKKPNVETDCKDQYIYSQIYSERNRALFALMGVPHCVDDLPEGLEIECLDYRIPSDCCPEIQAEINRWRSPEYNGFFFSYCTLKDLYVWYNKHKIIPVNSTSRQLAIAIPSLEQIILAVKDRMSQIGFISEYDWENKTEVFKEKSEDVRIVLWFDN